MLSIHALGLPGQVDDERFAADDRRRPAEHGARGNAQAGRANGLGNTGRVTVRDRARGLGRDVARGQSPCRLWSG